MTADRWWVRWGARWLARAEAVGPMIRLAMLGMTGLSTALLTLQQYGHSRYAWPLVAVVLGGSLAFTWLYTEGGVYNQQNRDKADFGDNYAGPTMRLNAEHVCRGLLAAQKGRPLDDDEREAIKRELDATFDEFRDGIDIEDDES